MRLAIRLAGILVVLLVTALIVLAVSLPRLMRSDAARSRIQQMAREATGREIRYGELDFGLMPPRLVVSEAEVKGESDGAPPVLVADGVELEIALAPLIAWTVVADKFVMSSYEPRLLQVLDTLKAPDAHPSLAGDAYVRQTVAHKNGHRSPLYQACPFFNSHLACQDY